MDKVHLMDKAYLVAVNVSAAEWNAPISAQPQIIGRGNEATILVRKSNFSVSRKHAKIWLDRSIWIEDLGSTYGTRVNGVKIPANRPTAVNLNDRVVLGLVEFLLVNEHGLAARMEDEKSASEDSRSDDPMIREFQGAAAGAQLSHATLEQLSHAEREVVMWIMRGVTEADEIAKQLNRSSNTIRTHLNNIFKKLNVHSRHELMAQVLRHNSSPEQNSTNPHDTA